jgi:hypothetical protein
MQKWLCYSGFLLSALLATVLASSGRAQCVSLTTLGSASTQNFDTLSNTAGSTTNNLTIPGWFMTESGGGARDNEQYAVDTGSSNTGDTYSYGAAGSTDRALGGLRSGTLIPIFGVCFTNNTGSAITSLNVAYTGEQWRLGTAGRTDQLSFEFSTNAADLVTGTWTGVAALNFVTPDTATVGAKNGNAAGERTALSSTIAVNVANGATFWIRWTDVDASGADDGLAVDDFSLTPTGGSSSPSGSGSATQTVAGGSTTLTANITPGTNPSSTGISVACDLTAIGGSSTFNLPNSSGNTYSAVYATPGGTAPQTYGLPCSVTDGQQRSGSFNISLTVTSASPTNPSGTGAASPSSVQAGASTLLTVTVVAGTNPTSTGIGVAADLSSIGGSSSQQFFDDGTNGDARANDGIFSFTATVGSGASPGGKSIPVTISDAQARSGSTSIGLTVQIPPPTSIKISQVFGGGGNSGATYSNDFIELFNQSNTAVDISGWSVQKASATASTWEVTNLCPNGGTCILQPGHYYLVQEAAGTDVNTVALPAPDMTGVIAMGAASGKIALVANTTMLTGACPTGGGIVDFVGYGGAGVPNCAEATATGVGSATVAAVRKNNGCVDTDNNGSDFVIMGPVPRNSSSPANLCGGNPTQLSGVGSAAPSSVDPAGSLVLSVAVTPATTSPSTGIAVTGNLTSIGGGVSQPFYDNGTHGDAAAGDNVFSFRTNTPTAAAFGAKSIQTTITDAQFRTANAPITITVQAPTCGVERWAVKTGTDPNAGLVKLLNPVRTTINAMRALTAPTLNPNPPYDPRFSPTEFTVFVINGMITAYKLEDDVDYHIVLQDPVGNTMITEIPSPACDGSTSPFDAAVAAVRAKFDARLNATDSFQIANLPVQMTGVGFFDFLHGQTGVAPNGIELHPILDMTFTTASSSVIASSANPAVFGQPVTLTATVASTGGTPTGSVNFYEGDDLLGTGPLNAGGQASITASNLAAGPHSITATYDGDANVAQSTSAAFLQNIGQAAPAITWANPADITFGSALGATQLNATASVPGTFVYTPASGAVLGVGNAQALSVVFTPTSSNYSAAAKGVSINVLPASNGGTPASLVVTRTLARINGQVVVTLTIANNGGTDAQNVMLTAAKIGTTSGTPVPQSLGTIAAGGSVQAVVNVPGTVGAAGAGNTLTISGTYTGGTFGSSARITLP